ncbi:MAG: hypothetical protein K6E56_00110 [Lachnospiraceae bacterium]|nr:hypothetical protein [Lachnospiraceae bacterium]
MKKVLYMGVDLGKKYAFISYSFNASKEPESFGGDENEPIAVPDIYSNGALADFINDIITNLPEVPDKLSLAITVKELDAGIIERLKEGLYGLNVPEVKLRFSDYSESYYNYLVNGPKELIAYDSVLFDYDGGDMLEYRCLSGEHKTKPQLLIPLFEEFKINTKEKDSDFSNICLKLLNKRIISSVYLVGDGFEGGWMKESLSILCAGRRVFLGKNLYSKGACFYAYGDEKPPVQDFAYIGSHSLKANVSVKVLADNSVELFTLASAGRPWYEEQNSLEVIVDKDLTVDFWIKKPLSRDTRIESVELIGLNKKADRTTRLLISAHPLSDTELKVIIEDVGFGDMFPSSGLKWEHTFNLDM